MLHNIFQIFIFKATLFKNSTIDILERKKQMYFSLVHFFNCLKEIYRFNF